MRQLWQRVPGLISGVAVAATTTITWPATVDFEGTSPWAPQYAFDPDPSGILGANQSYNSDITSPSGPTTFSASDFDLNPYGSTDPDPWAVLSAFPDA